jgi:hypothetical protein
LRTVVSRAPRLFAVAVIAATVCGTPPAAFARALAASLPDTRKRAWNIWCTV